MTFLNSDFPFIKVGQGETSQSEQPAERSQKSQPKMYPQICRRIQGQRLIFHLNPIATQSQPCEQRQVAFHAPSETIKLWKRFVPFNLRPTNRRNRLGNLITLANQDPQAVFSPGFLSGQGGTLFKPVPRKVLQPSWIKT